MEGRLPSLPPKSNPQNINMKKSTLIIFLLSLTLPSAQALRLEPIKYADMENWVTRNITESAIIVGQHKPCLL